MKPDFSKLNKITDTTYSVDGTTDAPNCIAYNNENWVRLDLSLFAYPEEFDELMERYFDGEYEVSDLKNMPYQMKEIGIDAARRCIDINDFNDHIMDVFEKSADVNCIVVTEDSTFRVNVESFDDLSDFEDFCDRLSNNDWYDIDDCENLPDALDNIDERLFDYLNLKTKDEQQMVEEYWEYIDTKASVKTIKDALVFKGSLYDFALDLLQNDERIPEDMRQYMDAEKYSADLEESYASTDNYVFSII